jgi:8-oxo-dGTP diphosphatase
MIEKAGGIITRTNTKNEREIYLIHRARYNDWSLPKGHMEAGESAESAAVRETAEETGFVCTAKRPLPDYVYQLPNGAHAVVHFFECHIDHEDVTQKDTEADRGEWMTIAEACSRISYPSQQVYLLTAFSE